MTTPSCGCVPPADDASSPTCLIRVSVHFEEADDSCANVARYDGTEAAAAEERKKRVKRRPEAGAEGARAARRMEGARADENDDDDDDDEYNEDSIIIKAKSNNKEQEQVFHSTMVVFCILRNQNTSAHLPSVANDLDAQPTTNDLSQGSADMGL